jgi:hypothetical protein
VQLKTYDWRITETMEGGHYTNCYTPLCPSDFPTKSVTLSDGTYRGGSWLCVNPERKVSEQACEAARFVGLEEINRRTDPFDTPVQGELPPVVLIRKLRYGENGVDKLSCTDPSVIFPDESLMPSTTGDFYECADAWVVHLKKK